MGVERKSVAMSEHERITCAYHEAGHAVVAALLPDADPLHKVTIIPRGRALGVTMQLPEADRYTHSKPFIEAQIAILMGGRVAEELFLRQMTSGASNDIERATELARKMVCELGMSPLGPVHFRRPSGAWDTDTRAAGFSEETARRVDEEIRGLVMRGYETARQIVERQRAAVKALAEELLEVESVDADRLKQIVAGTSSPATPEAHFRVTDSNEPSGRSVTASGPSPPPSLHRPSRATSYAHTGCHHRPRSDRCECRATGH